MNNDRTSTTIFYERGKAMKKIIVFLLCVFVLVGCTTKKAEVDNNGVVSGNYTDEMKMEYAVDLDEYGADSVEREGDHPKSPYFAQLDFYNMESTDTLTILTNFKTYQQTSEWSCGVVAVMMVLEYYGRLGDWNEETLARLRTNELEPEATSLESVLLLFEGVGGFEVDSTYDYDPELIWEEITMDMIQDYLQEGVPVIVAWNDWGGHWQVIIGYDTMGTETLQDDVIIVADSYDTTDHNQDGYGVYPAERFYYNWTMYDFFQRHYDIDERDLLFAAPRLVEVGE